MGMPYGLAKATNYYNKLEAQRDWLKVCQEATAAGMTEREIVQLAPPVNAGWKTIDKHIAKLRAAIANQLLESAK